MPRLSDLPNELLEMIVCLLDYRDICNFRLVSRAIDAGSTQAHFKSFFGEKTVELDSIGISRLAAITQHGRFGDLLRDLTLIGTEGPECFSSEDAGMLCMVFQDLCNFHKQRGQYSLRSLTATITAEAVTFQSALRSAAGAFAVRTILRMVNDSNIHIEKIDLHYHSMLYSVPCCVFQNPFGFIQPKQPTSNWSALRCLSLSLTHHAKHGVQVGLIDMFNDAFDSALRESAEARTQRVQALVDFFSLISNIEELNLHWYGLPLSTSSPTAADAVESIWFNQVSLSVSFPNLKHLVLRGLHLTQSTLKKLLTAPSLQQVHLEYIHLTGSFRPILDILTSANTAITRFYLDDVYEQKLVHFTIEGRPKFPWLGRVPGPSTVLRKGEEVRLPLEYGFADGDPLSSVELWEWRKIRWQEYGFS